ncbi:MAG: isocitrate lyase/phosphoenolpyruvate mutase family protein [Nitrososphaerota archaeon]|nr:isocitrate lyase/phosphoenolpyruvate mutase family protein [Nitrososphaerota archaeon]
MPTCCRPLSADVVGGFGDSPEGVGRGVKAVIAAGAVGINIEDFVHVTKKLLPVEKQLQGLKALVRLREKGRVRFVINARTNAPRFAPGGDEVRLDEAIRRASEEERAHGRQTQCAFQRSQTCVTECFGMLGTCGA